MQNPLKIIFPDQCAGCGGMVEGDAGLCAACWSETRFLQGLACDACAAPLLGPGDVVVIPADLPHEATCVGDVEEMDMWSPRRQDWLDGTDDYLRK